MKTFDKSRKTILFSVVDYLQGEKEDEESCFNFLDINITTELNFAQP